MNQIKHSGNSFNYSSLQRLVEVLKNEVAAEDTSELTSDGSYV